MNKLKQIFLEHYEEIQYILHPRPVVMENIEKMVNCGDPSYGGAMYGCPCCGELKFVPFRCHSKFCPTCGNKYCIDRSTKMSFKLIRCTHRHLVFTIDENLRHFFLEDRSLLNCLFQAVRSVLLEIFHKLNKSKNFVPGFICVLHTFGRPLEWNPHIHCLLTEGGFSDDGFWRVVKYFDYNYLRKSFQTALLNLMLAKLGDSFKKTKSLIYKKDKNGFYVYAKPNLCDPDTVVKYISRYLGRPVIASSRIDSYDGENVTFHYNKHEDNSYVQKTLPVLDFIKLLIQHIPEKHFKMTRYYGLYARHREIDNSLHKAVSKSKHRIILDFNTWRKLILLSFGYDPLQCPKCNHTMEFLELYHNHKPVSLQESYERTMAKAKCRSS
ncbi:MAG: transposase [Hespellia sp.]|nr:transposase [Hespellia sp.]